MDRVLHFSSDLNATPTPAWRAGLEPVPGYRLIEPLGRGGFGEVWKCEAPGGLFKAIKCVNGNNGNGQLATQELEALQRVKAIRHPFILSLERVEVIGGVLLIVMELADKNLQVLHAEARARGQAGVPRDELLALLLEAAEALDWMNFEHGLQHLDIKPFNLFLVSNHLKVADFGLVHAISDKDGPSPYRAGGATPLYASPEILRGNVSRHSDQYSLAIVFQQMLTGSVPFFSNDAHQLMMQHLTAEPDLSGLPPKDRPIVAHALAKDPGRRFASCLDFLHHLSDGTERKTARGGRGPKHESAPPEPVPDSTRVVNDLAQVPAQEYKTAPGRILSPDGARVQSGPERDQSVVSSRFIPPGFEVKPLTIPGLKLDKCLGKNPLGEYWLARDEEGREFRALCTFGTTVTDEKLVQRLRAVQHPVLPPCGVLRASSDRLALVTCFYEGTLRDRFEACRAAGLPGIPRAELLDYLRSAAEALDGLYEQWQVSHLGLNPRNLLVERGRVWMADYGLVQLLWLPGGQSAAHLNPRYAAPELSAGNNGPAADQYALALIHAEMLSGFHPQNVRRSGKSGPIRRSGMRRATDTHPATAKVDLDMVVASDREILARALHPDPALRFPTCSALVAALHTAIADRARVACANAVPRVATCAALLGTKPADGLIVPGVGQLLAELPIRPPFRVLSGGQKNSRYFVHGDGFWSYSCPVQIFPNALKLKLDGFKMYWNAKAAQHENWLSVYQLEIPVPDDAAAKNGGRSIAVEVRVEVQPLKGKTVGVSEARAIVRPVWERGPQVFRALERIAPRLFDSLRSFLQGNPEQRCEERWACSQPVRVFPFGDGSMVGAPLEGVCRDISRCGVRFRVTEPLDTKQVYLNWYKISRVAPFALLARVLRAQKVQGGSLFEVGAIFNQ